MIQSQFNTRSVVINIIMLNAVVYLAQALMPELNTQMIRLLGLHAPQSENFMITQLVTYMFLHGNFSHLFFNMFALWMFGRMIEYDLGPKRFLTYYMITGIGAGVLNMGVNWFELQPLIQQFSTSDPIGLANYLNSYPPTIGASGAVFGILIAFGMMYPNNVIMLLIPPIPIKAKYFVIIYGLLELYLGFSGRSPGVAHFAHLGGMLFGYIMLKYWKSKGKIYF